MKQQPYAWAIQGCERMWRGEFAEIDAQAEAARCGGTCEAFPLYTTPQPASKGCKFCTHPLYAGTKCKNCGMATDAQIVADIVRATKNGAAAWAGVDPQTLRAGTRT